MGNVHTPRLLIISPEQSASQAVAVYLAELDSQGLLGKYYTVLINEAGESIKIDQVRQLITELGHASHLNQTRVIALLTADQLTLPAQHALLKSLEEPPTETLLLLVTSYPQQLLDTIVSRCLRVSVANDSSESSLTTELLEPKLLAHCLGTSSLGVNDIIELSTKYKSRELAVSLVTQLIFHAHQQKAPARVSQQLVLTAQQLQQNLNPQLALEGCFFAIGDLI